jgi:peptidoglycan/xylan/chitin deacetylase (PgdA/CDA1 family)
MMVGATAITVKVAILVAVSVFGLLLGFAAIVVFQPRFALAWLGRRSPEVLFYIETGEPLLALTIDDGPDPETTPLILDVLAEHGAHATFFLTTNRVTGSESIVRRILEEGHEIGNHMTEDEPSIRLSEADFERKLNEAHETLSRFTTPRWFRPASGWYNTRMLEQLRQHNYSCALGSVYPFDSFLPFVWFTAFRVAISGSPGSVVILHDGGKRGIRTARALRHIIPSLKNRGLRLETLSNVVEREKTKGAAN